MSDEPSKKIVSVPPPPTDEIDSEWGGKGADESGKSATQAADEGTTPARDASSAKVDARLKRELAGQGETAAPPRTPAPAAASDEEDEDDSDDEDEDEDEDDSDDEDEDEDEDEEDSARHAAGSVALSHSARPSSGADWLPNWAPFAVLSLLVIFGVAGGLGAFTKPAPLEASAPSEPSAAAGVPTSIQASHFLVQYKGAMRAPEKIQRTKEEAKARAQEGLAKARRGADFGKVVAEYSDEPGAAERAGSLGEFQAGQMVKPFSDAAFKLKVGEVSGLVETDFGFHVIKRTK